MKRKGPAQLLSVVTRLYPELPAPEDVIRAGHVLVDGRPVSNPASVVGPRSNVTIAESAPLRGEAKLQAALAAFGVRIEGRIALDVGAAAGGFTRVLLARGAARVYAVDAGHGQLLGSLRQSSRVVNLEATNLAALNPRLVPDEINVFTLDLSYLSLAAAVPQLELVAVTPNADLVALVKPMFELQLPKPPEDRETLERALAAAVEGINAARWRVVGSIESPVLGGRGAFEFLVHARRRPTTGA